MKNSCQSRQLHVFPSSITMGILTLSLFLGLAAPNVESGEKSSSGKSGSFSTENSTENLNHQIDDLETQIQKLREQSLELQEKTRLRLKAQIDLLQKQRDSLVPRIERLRDNSEMAWQDIKENIQKAIEELKQSVDVMEK